MKRILNILLMLVSLLQMNAQVDKYPYVVVTPNADNFELTDSAFYHISKKITYPVNGYTISPDSKFYKDMVNEVLPFINQQGMQLQKVIMRGAASPEGPYEWNETLCKKRAQSVLDLVDHYSKIPSDVTFTKLVPEDYMFLLRLMKFYKDPDYNRVAAIVNKYIDVDMKTLKEKLIQLDNKKVWKKMKAKYFPSLRCARFVLVFAPPRIIVEQFNVDSLARQLPERKLDIPTLNYDLSYLFECKPAPVVEKVKEPKYPVLSVKTNLLYDALWSPKTGFEPTPNVEAELYFRNGWFSLLAEYEFPWWKDEPKREFFQIQNEQLEARYYFKHDHWYNGLFIGPYLMANRFDFALRNNEGSGVQGEGIGAGLSFGYVVPLGKKTSRWKLEFDIKGGYYETHYDPYDYEYSESTHTGKYYYRWYQGKESFKLRNWRYRWIGPTGVGITISYDLIRGYKKLNNILSK